MEAIILTDYGPPDVLKPKEIDLTTPNANEVLVKVFTTGDCEM
jgi:NADPH:quinone reductase-like Zn-dependent oxidoreductase